MEQMAARLVELTSLSLSVSANRSEAMVHLRALPQLLKRLFNRSTPPYYFKQPKASEWPRDKVNQHSFANGTIK